MAHGNGFDGNAIPLQSNNDDARTVYKMENLNLKELSTRPLPLGLKLTLTPEMLPLTEQKTNVATKIGTACQLVVKKAEKLKAVHFPMYMLMIGFFKVEAKYPADLVAKFYYAKRKLVWEMLRDGLKDKIEIQWQNISAIRAVTEENLPGILEIELDKVPLFFREIEPKPGKHTMWAISHDFTDGQASKYRRHYLQFPPGVLDRYYAKLLQCDNRLLELSQRPFPSSCATYFDQGTTHVFFCHDSKTTSPTEQLPILVSHQQVQLVGPLPLLANYNNPISPTPDKILKMRRREYISTFDHTAICSPTDESINNQMLITSWSQDLHHDTSLSMQSVPRANGIQQNGPVLNYELPSPINNMLLRGYHISEIEFDRSVELVSPNVGQSIYSTNMSTQIDWSHTNKNSWNVRTDHLEQQYNANLNPMPGYPFMDQPCSFYPEELISPNMQ